MIYYAVLVSNIFLNIDRSFVHGWEGPSLQYYTRAREYTLLKTASFFHGFIFFLEYLTEYLFIIVYLILF